MAQIVKRGELLNLPKLNIYCFGFSKQFQNGNFNYFLVEFRYNLVELIFLIILKATLKIDHFFFFFVLDL